MYGHVLQGPFVLSLTKLSTLMSVYSPLVFQPQCTFIYSSCNISCTFTYTPLCLCSCHFHSLKWHFLLLLSEKFLLILQNLFQVLLLLQKLPGYSKAEFTLRLINLGASLTSFKLKYQNSKPTTLGLSYTGYSAFSAFPLLPLGWAMHHVGLLCL